MSDALQSDALIKLLLDEHIWEGLAARLRNDGFDVVHVSETTLRGEDDEPLLAWAASQGRAILTFNHKDFVPLARAWFQANRWHAGVILSTELSRGELLRLAQNLLKTLDPDSLANTVRWLQSFR